MRSPLVITSVSPSTTLATVAAIGAAGLAPACPMPKAPNAVAAMPHPMMSFVRAVTLRVVMTGLNFLLWLARSRLHSRPGRCVVTVTTLSGAEPSRVGWFSPDSHHHGMSAWDLSSGGTPTAHRFLCELHLRRRGLRRRGHGRCGLAAHRRVDRSSRTGEMMLEFDLVRFRCVTSMGKRKYAR